MWEYKVFTWNMQRGQSVSRTGDTTIAERFRVLQALVNWAHFGFIVEPGRDIRDRLSVYSTLPGLPAGRFYVSALDDRQNDAAACRPAVYSKLGFTGIPPNGKPYARFSSGADAANRYPALGIVTLPNGDGQGNNKLLLVSFHATSGYGATQNCEGYFDLFYEFDGNSSVPLLWIVGGDFNCNPREGVYMPPTSTHQSDHVLDGFFADQQATNFEVKLASGPQTYGQLITDTSVDPHGFVVNGHHVSDHRPVIAKFRIKRCPADVDVDTANILPGGTKRARAPSTGYGGAPAKRIKT